MGFLGIGRSKAITIRSRIVRTNIVKEGTSGLIKLKKLENLKLPDRALLERLEKVTSITSRVDEFKTVLSSELLRVFRRADEIPLLITKEEGRFKESHYLDTDLLSIILTNERWKDFRNYIIRGEIDREIEWAFSPEEKEPVPLTLRLGEVENSKNFFSAIKGRLGTRSVLESKYGKYDREVKKWLRALNNLIGRTKIKTESDKNKEIKKKINPIKNSLDNIEINKKPLPYDLSGLNLTDAYLKAINFKYVDFTGANLNRADLTFADLYRANLKGVKATGTAFGSAHLTLADLEGIDLSVTDIKSNTKLLGAKITKIIESVNNVDIINEIFEKKPPKINWVT